MVVQNPVVGFWFDRNSWQSNVHLPTRQHTLIHIVLRAYLSGSSLVLIHSCNQNVYFSPLFHNQRTADISSWTTETHHNTNNEEQPRKGSWGKRQPSWVAQISPTIPSVQYFVVFLPRSSIGFLVNFQYFTWNWDLGDNFPEDYLRFCLILYNCGRNLRMTVLLNQSSLQRIFSRASFVRCTAQL